jgi:hypothetical protein
LSQPRNHMVLIGQQPGEPGRARKYFPEACQVVKDLAQKGKFPEYWCGILGIAPRTLRYWVQVHEEFREACEIARIILTAWWTSYTQAHLTDVNLKTAPLIETLRKRFPELYGKNPMDIWAYLFNDDPSTAIAPIDKPASTMTKEQRDARIAELEKQRAAMKG